MLAFVPLHHGLRFFPPFPPLSPRRHTVFRNPLCASAIGDSDSALDAPDISKQHPSNVIPTHDAPQIDPDFCSVVEHTSAPPWKFNGKRVYMVDMNASECDVIEDTLSPNFFQSPRSLLRFLVPVGWPSTVAPGYTHWVKWHICRHIFRNAYYVLGTTSLLYSLGLGTTQSLAVGATLKWVLKDGLGMATKLLISTQLAGIVDTDPKRWRFFGDSLMALSACIEILSVCKPTLFLLYGTIAALLKEAGDAMSGPAYRVFLDSFAISSNIGDVSGRGEAQVVVGNLIGLALGVALKTFLDAHAAPDRLAPTLALFGILAASHLTSTFKAVSTVHLRTLNWQRLNLIIDEYLSTGKVPSVEAVNKTEKFIYALSPPPAPRRLRVGAPLLDFVECGRDVTAALRHSNDRFIVAFNNNCVGIMLREDVQPDDLLQAMLHGRKLLQAADENGGCSDWNRERIAQMTAETYRWTLEAIPGFLSGLSSQGWSKKKMLVATESSSYKHDHSS